MILPTALRPAVRLAWRPDLLHVRTWLLVACPPLHPGQPPPPAAAVPERRLRSSVLGAALGASVMYPWAMLQMAAQEEQRHVSPVHRLGTLSLAKTCSPN